MSELSSIIDELKRSFDGEAWHGPALMEVLDGIDARGAAARPISHAHSIWELVLHLAAWEKVITRRLQGHATTLTDAENFGHIESTTEKTWQSALETLRQNHAELIKTVEALSDSRLNDRVPGKDYDVRFMLHGAAQHAAYHGGQIAILKRIRR